MGKSNKKAKSDRINALRKQYDAFLEEDKKRKERNDFILGRLDKMRYTTALVPVRYKPNVFETRPTVVDHLGFKPEISSININQTQLVPDVQINNNEDTYLIQEISKKYILIPKLRTKFLNNCIKNGTTNENREKLQEIHFDQDAVPIKELKPISTEHDHSDWKSKYEILNILKDEERGKSTSNYQTSFEDLKQSLPKDRPPENIQDQVAINYDNYVNTHAHVDTPKKYVNENPEKDLPADTLHYDLPKDSGSSFNNTVHVDEVLVTKTDTRDNKQEFVASVDQADTIGNQFQNITIEYQDSDAHKHNIDISRDVINYQEPQPVLDGTMTSMVADCSRQSIQINEEKCNVEDEYPVVASSLIDNQNESVEQYKPVDSEQVFFAGDSEISPLETLNYNSPSTLVSNDHVFENETLSEDSNNKEYAPNNDHVQMKTDATDILQEQIYVSSNVDTVGEAEPVIETTEKQAHVTESIEDFNAEQSEMFYSEQTNDNYPSQHGGEEQPVGYAQNEYSQNQEYAYYENTEAEPYHVELNDEEVTQQYDPSYEQQYTALDQAAEQQQYTEQYQESENFTNQDTPQFEVEQYEQQYETQGDIEETLDIEDGYTVQQSGVPSTAVELPSDENPIDTEKSDDK